MRPLLLVAVSAFALTGTAALAQDAVPADAAAPAAEAAVAGSGSFSDAQLTAFSTAMARMSTVAEAVAGGTPTAEQQAEMAAAVEASGLGVEQFNAISTSVSTDTVLQARLAVLNAPEPAAGSVAASVTDAEVEQFSTTMAQIRILAPAGGTPTPEQQTAMAAAVESSGLALERFNEISTALSADAQLRARVQLADAQRAS